MLHGRYEARYRALEAEERGQYREFAETVQPVAKLFADWGIDFSVSYISFAEMLGSPELEASHRKALGRYIV